MLLSLESQFKTLAVSLDPTLLANLLLLVMLKMRMCPSLELENATLQGGILYS